MSKSPGRFGKWLKRELARRGHLERGGLSRFARSAGLDLSVLSRALNEGRMPETDALRRIGRALGYSLGDMLIFAGIADPEELVATQPATKYAAVEADEADAGEPETRPPVIDLETFVPETAAERALMAIYLADKREREAREGVLYTHLQELSEKVDRLKPHETE
jgi:transcriptional regulator with XRE-family HTH domain